MARKTFTLNDTPHEAEIPSLGVVLKFVPEVMGDEFLDAYAEMREAQRRESGVDVEDLDAGDVEQLRKVTGSLRVFLSRLMLPESAALITRVDVVRGGEVLESFPSWEEAQAYAAGVKGGGARPVWALRLPDRLLLQLLDWTLELYTGGRRPPTSSGASATPSSRGGTRSTGTSRSAPSTRISGRSAVS